MASFSGKGRDEGPKRRPGDSRRSRIGKPTVESLEQRRLLDASSNNPVWRATTNDVFDVKNGPMANLGPELITVYKEFSQYSQGGSQGNFQSSLASKVFIRGNMAGVSVRGTGDLASFQNALTTLGMQITATAPEVKVVEGYIPIYQLPALATQAQLAGGKALFIPTTFVGSANNQSDRTLFADVARNTYGLTGAGVKIGVMSDSVNLVGGGVAASIASGDLPASGVQIIQDLPPGGTPSDEGRAMLEQIHDIAPGASLAFATGFTGEAEFANNIRALAAAGCTIIVDDIGYFADPAFQDGIITNAVNEFVAGGGIYLSSAGNSGSGGYLSQFRGTSATVGSIGAGRFMDFDPSSGVSTLLPIQITRPTDIWMQFAQPFYKTGGVTSDLDIYILNADGSIAARSSNQNIAAGEPVDSTTPLAPGSYNVAIRVVSGPDPSYVTFYDPRTSGTIVSKQFGSAGNTYYPTTFGHNAAPNAIGVGAVPWWAAQPFTATATPANESFSSDGPAIRLFDFAGNAVAPTLLQKPDLSAPDGNNTSFFQGPSDDIDTTRTNPSTPTNLDPDLLPNFFGTSSAAPNLAAVVALMKQANPNLGRQQILNALTATATPLNGAAPGAWDVRGGFGLANAQAAIASVSAAKVDAISPNNTQSVTVAPPAIYVRFSKPINFATAGANDMVVTGPNGVTVVVGNPFPVDNSAFPTLIAFPITLVRAPGVIANGVYNVTIPDGAFVAQDGTGVFGGSTTYNLQQTTAPQVVATSFENRLVAIKFSVPIDPSTITPANVFLVRAGGLNGPLNDPVRNQVVSSLPGARLTFDAVNNVAYIDLKNVDPALLPSDHYALVVTPSVTDAVGNPLNGAFSGTFPSGTNPANASFFVQDLGNVLVQAPIIVNVGLAAGSDTGVQGDQNTYLTTPSLTGRVLASNFLGTVAGVTVAVQFNGIIHPGLASGSLNLGPGADSRGVVGFFDAVAITDANGIFTIQYPPSVAPLPAGLNKARVLAIAPSDLPGQQGKSSSVDFAFRVDQSLPYIGTVGGTQPSSIPENSRINGLTTLTLQVVDPVKPQNIGSPFAVGTQLSVSALDPVSVANIGNYELYQVTPNGQGGVNFINRSTFIASAAFTPTTVRTFPNDPYTGFITLSFNTGLPAGRYFLRVKTGGSTGNGLKDASGLALAANATDSAMNVASDYILNFDIEPTPVYITGYAAASRESSGPPTMTGPRGIYEIPLGDNTRRAPVAPGSIAIDFSTSLRAFDANGAAIDYTNLVRLVRSADPGSGFADGNFGDLGYTNLSGFSYVPGVSVTLDNNRLVITLPNDGASLPADYYRVYIPNRIADGTAIYDIFGNQLDGEFLGYQDANGKFVNLMPTGQLRGSGATEAPSLSGDGVAGGSFTTGFVVVPNGNVIYARPDYYDDPFIADDDPDGSVAKPYPALAPEAVASTANGNNLNDVRNFGLGFNPALDRNGNGRFDRSALFAAQQRTLLNGGPAAVILQPALQQRDPITGVISQKTFVLQAPAGSDPLANDASTSVPALTTLAFSAGSTLKMLNASLFVQNQGSALQILGGPNPGQQVTITSYKDDSVGGDTNNDRSDSSPAPGDFGGLVFRNYTQAGRSSLFGGQIPSTGNSSVDNRLKAVSRNNGAFTLVDAITGADDVMSFLNFMTETYAGGAVAATTGTRYDGVTLYNSRPAIVNSRIANTGGGGTLQAPISADVDSFREDYAARGPLIRNDSFLNNGLNGIYVRAQFNGIAQATDAVDYPSNPDHPTGDAIFTFDDPYAHLLISRLEVGSQLQVETGGATSGFANRLYIQPGMMVKSQRGAAIQVVSSLGSLNVGERTYMDQFDDNPAFGPTTTPNTFKANKLGDARVLFTSLYDDVATTTYFDPVAQITRTIVAALASVLGAPAGLQPTANNVPDLSRWGGVTITTGAVAVIDEANFRYGGGTVNTAGGTGTIQALELAFGNSPFGGGARVSVTNNNFNSNADVPINLQPNGLLAGDLTRPLLSGAPFIHGNVFQGNGIDGVGIWENANTFVGQDSSNLNVNSVWPGTDFTYVLRSTIVMDTPLANPIPAAPSSTTLQPEPTPNLLLTLQSTPAGTVLADGTTVDLPGVPLIVKMLGAAASDVSTVQSPATTNDVRGGAGFLVGVDDGVDTNDALIDPGAFAQLRIVGIAANQTTGQARVPVILTSLRDNTVGTTVRNVPMFDALPNDSTAPTAGDGGVIYFGGNSLTDYNLQDVRDGNVIDNADIRYMSRVEQQGGGIVYVYDLNGSNGFDAGDQYYQQKLGIQVLTTLPNGQQVPTAGVGYATQYNQSKALTISNSNFSSFRDIAFLAHPGYGALFAGGFSGRNGARGQATHSYLYNNTFSNMPTQTAVEIRSETQDNTNFPSPAMAVLLNNTFYDVGTAIRGVAPAASNTNSLSHVSILAMDNIFSDIRTAAVVNDGQNIIPREQSNLQYNLFYNVAGDNFSIGTSAIPNNQPVFGNPMFRNAVAGDFNLMPGSAAIDAGRSELGPSFFGDMLYPAVTINNNNLNQTPIRNQLGRTNPNGGLGGAPIPQDIVTLPGYPIRGFPDQFRAVAAGTPGSSTLPNAQNVATFAYATVNEARDILGNQRVKSPTSSNVGFGSRPFFDLGAYEYIVQNPPQVVSAAVTTEANPVLSPIYSVGGTAGTNSPPTAIYVGFNQQINPATINAATVLLLASGGDGIFGNGNSQADTAINLQGRLAFDPITKVLSINTSGLVTRSDEYRIILKGTGSQVLRNPDGSVLDGENIENGVQRALPSGDQFPGGDFQLTFTLDSSAPQISPGTFRLAPSSDTSNGALVTRNNRPTFVGTVNDVFPPVNAAAGLNVFIDISTRGDGNFDLLNAGTGTTDANGNFSVTLNQALPDTPVNVGPDGIKGTADDLRSFARLRVVDQAGNVSNLPTDPIEAYNAKGATAFFTIDTASPKVTGFSPSGSTVATIDASGQLVVTSIFNETIDPASLNANSIQVIRAGGDGSFTDGNEVVVGINGGSFTSTPLFDATGSVRITFSLAGSLANDIYAIRLLGTGSSPVTDIAKNPLDGANTGFGSDFVNGPFTVFSPSLANTLFVDGTRNFAYDPTLPIGSRFNPYVTIGDALAASVTGDQILVLPGTYRENINLRAGVRVLSADASSTDGLYVPGSPQQTLIYGASNNNNFTSGIVTVAATNLTPVAGIDTEISGFSIIAPLLTNSVTGSIDPNSIGLLIVNSDVLVDRNFIINAGFGINVSTTSANAPVPRIVNNGIIGNIYGIGIGDQGANGAYGRAGGTTVTNNTIANNTTGLYSNSRTPNAFIATVRNNIFYANHDLSVARAGTGIDSQGANTLAVGNNLFQGNGPSQASNADDAFGVFVGFEPATLDAIPDAYGNFAGNAAFVAARDPRPNGDTPAVFFLDGNYDLTLRSAAIDSALDAFAPATDFLGRGRVRIDGRGFSGPADIGAFEFRGTGGVAVGGQLLRVVTTSLSADGTTNSGAAIPSNQTPTYIDVDISSNVDPSSVQPSDLVLSGTGVNAANPAHATSLAWLDGHTVRFFLTGAFNASGTVKVSIAAGAMTDRTGRPIAEFVDSFTIGAATSSNGTVTPGITPPVQPSGPQGLGGKKARAAAKARAKAAAKAAAKAKAKAAAEAKAKAKAAAKKKAAELAQKKAAARAAAKLAAKQKASANKGQKA